MPINIHHLMLFEAISRSATITEAAEKLLVSQPAVSKQLRELEQALAIQLVERGARKIRLTPAGQAVAEIAQKIARLVEQVPQSIADLNALRRGHLRVGATPSIATYLLPDLLVRFTRKYPGVRLHVETENTPILAERLKERAIDLALTESTLHTTEIHCRIFAQNEMIPVVSPDHPFARRILTLREFLAEPFIAHAPFSGMLSHVEQILSARGTEVRPAFSLPSTEAIKRAVAAGLGVAIIPRLSATTELRDKRLAPVTLKAFSVHRPLYHCTQAGVAPSKPLIAFDCLLKHAVRGTLPPLQK